MNNTHLADIVKMDYFKNECEIKYIVKNNNLHFVAWKVKGTLRWFLIDYSKKMGAYEIGMIGISSENKLCVHYYEVFKEFKKTMIEKFLHIKFDANDWHYIHNEFDYNKAFHEWLKLNDYSLIE